jgi:hypothetical protein
MTTSEITNISTLPRVTGIMLSKPCTMVRSEIERLTTWPVCSSSCRLPSSRVSEPSSSVRRSYCTSRDTRPP